MNSENCMGLDGLVKIEKCLRSTENIEQYETTRNWIYKIIWNFDRRDISLIYDMLQKYKPGRLSGN
jgi:hypothetical protein